MSTFAVAIFILDGELWVICVFVVWSGIECSCGGKVDDLCRV